jgi:hypothetical protein
MGAQGAWAGIAEDCADLDPNRAIIGCSLIIEGTPTREQGYRI